METEQSKSQQQPTAPGAGGGLAAPTGSDILCKLVGADMGDDTITLQLPPGMRPRGMVIGEMIIIQRHCPNEKGEL